MEYHEYRQQKYKVYWCERNKKLMRVLVQNAYKAYCFNDDKEQHCNPLRYVQVLKQTV